jgi:hypothetical protein
MIALTATAQPKFSTLLKNKQEKKSLHWRASEKTTTALRSSLEPGDARPDSIVYKNTDGSYSFKSLFAYAGDTIKEASYYPIGTLDPTTGEFVENWVLNAKEEYVFDANGNRTLYILFSYHLDGSLGESYKEENDYRPNGMPLSEKFYVYNPEKGIWKQNTETLLEFGEDGLPTGGSGFLATLSGNLEISILVSIPERGVLEMILSIGGNESSKSVIHYNPDIYAEKFQQLAIETYEKEGEEWVEESRTAYEYDEAGRLKKETCTGSVNYETIYEYDPQNGNKLSETNTEELYGPEVYVVTKIVYEYEGNRRTKSTLFVKDYLTEDFELWETGDYYYSPSGIRKSVAEAAVAVYPNPASEQVSFTLPPGQSNRAVLHISDVKGSLLLSTPVTNNHPVSIKQLSGGLYIYRIIGDNRIYSGKLLVK